MRSRSSSVLFLVLLALAALGPVAGAQVEPLVGSPTLGKWTPPFPWPHVAIHMHLLPDGRVLTWAREADGSPPGLGIAPAAVWDPASNTFTDVTYTAIDIFCAGHSFLADGRLFIAGGHIVDGQGITNTTIFDFATNSWTPGPQMNAGRWYPTNTTLANGDVLVVSGSNVGGTNSLPQVYQAASGTFRSLTSAVQSQPLYPRMFLAPDGRVLSVGPSQTTQYLDTSGTGLWTTLATSLWGYRDYGTAVLYDTGKVLIAGGGDPPTNTAEVLDLSAPTPTWRYTAFPMHYVRRQLNSTLLPDGKVLVTGGTSSPGFNNVTGKVLPAEVWDPVSETWTVLASMKVPRIYHGTTVLLPDARVLSSGSGRPPGSGGDVDHLDAEIFSPPYLFRPDGRKAARPKVSAAPSSVAYGESFVVTTTQSAKIRKVTWLRLSSTTHAFNLDQRINFLTFAKVVGGIRVTAPSDPNLSPPGYYMLFLINDVGAPSIARIIRIG
jgi:hypothetical protein